jgi:acyl dehydratase
MVTVIDSPEALQALIGSHLGYSEWHTVTQHQIDLFAEATGDHQWIHVDAERAAAGPFGATIAHGYLTMSMGALMTPSILRIEGMRMALNYGCDRVRFPQPVRVGSNVRLGIEMLAADEVAGTIQVRMRFTFEIENEAKPACVSEVLARYAW